MLYEVITDGNFFYVLVGCKSTVTYNAFPAPTDHTGIFAQSGINDFIFDLTAIRALHESPPCFWFSNKLCEKYGKILSSSISKMNQFDIGFLV